MLLLWREGRDKFTKNSLFHLTKKVTDAEKSKKKLSVLFCVLQVLHEKLMYTLLWSRTIYERYSRYALRPDNHLSSLNDDANDLLARGILIK